MRKVRIGVAKGDLERGTNDGCTGKRVGITGDLFFDGHIHVKQDGYFVTF